jgi:hypothetical protein
VSSRQAKKRVVDAFESVGHGHSTGFAMGYAQPGDEIILGGGAVAYCLLSRKRRGRHGSHGDEE